MTVHMSVFDFRVYWSEMDDSKAGCQNLVHDNKRIRQENNKVQRKTFAFLVCIHQINDLYHEILSLQRQK